MSRADERPIRGAPGGAYNLDFFDTDNEFETFGLERQRMNEAAFRHDFQRFATALAARDFISDAEFDREWTYERLQELDARIEKRGGLPVTIMRKLLRPVRYTVDLHDTPCTICLERCTPDDRLARLLCGHTFHCHCLQTWLQEQYTCPMCRKDLRPPEAPSSASDGGRGSAAAAGGT